MQSTGGSWRKLYPFASHYMELDGRVRMHYVDEGSSEPEDKCIVAVHGNPTWSFYYRSIVEAMRGNHRVLAVDHIGCGLSDKPQKYPYCLATHTANLVRWIEKLDLRNIVMVVHDWGGAIGLGAAIECRDRIAGLVVLNTGAFPPRWQSTDCLDWMTMYAMDCWHRTTRQNIAWESILLYATSLFRRAIQAMAYWRNWNRGSLSYPSYRSISFGG
jgi:pimeloyl-ACP methyl ester carboxylesterase